MNNKKTSKEIQKEVFSHNLRTYMSSLGITQTDLMNDLNLPSATVSSWVNGQRMPRMDKIQLLADYMHITKSDLIENVVIGRFEDKKSAEDFREALIRIFDKIHRKVELTSKEKKLIDRVMQFTLPYESSTFPEDMEQNTIVIDTDTDENHPFNIIQKKIDNGEKLTPEELTQYKEHISKALPSIRQTLENFGESLKKSFSQYYALLNDEGQKEADIQIKRTIERVTEQAENQVKEEAENQIKLLTRIPEYQKKQDD